jgi:GT2 family glycosyltransferase
VRHSVCIVTFEREEYLGRCLKALAVYTSSDTQVVVVDASAVDSSNRVHAILPSTDYIFDRSVAGWMTRARNVALGSAKGDIVSFIDDDVVVWPGWQQNVLLAFDDCTVDAVVGRTRNGQPGEDFYEQPVGRLRPDGSLTEGFASLTSTLVDVDHGIGANMSFRRSILARLGGFRDDYPGTAMREDTDIFLRIIKLGARSVFAPEAVVDHLPAPHAKGERFNLRYKLYARRNHMVLLARYAGIRSPLLRRWVARELRLVAEAPTPYRRLRRLGVTVVGLGWGCAAMVRQARWSPLPPERTDATAHRLRAALSD